MQPEMGWISQPRRGTKEARREESMQCRLPLSPRPSRGGETDLRRQNSEMTFSGRWEDGQTGELPRLMDLFFVSRSEQQFHRCTQS